MEELKRIVVEDREDGTQITRLPNNEEMMEKINELIRYTKQLDKNKQSKQIKSAGTVTHRGYC
ncbi:hypothetical protein ACQKN7_28575 [Bacillus cereus]|uniref:Uncharacterized protein n=1 Tax=Bacillus thuringiensis TaxID=1428 RepID=A0AAW9JGA8_BACTU|nr:hypothetical protein [Bacillus thuringiensis]MDZ5480427.1 hypothetical protein [Bacillus thuringiensis]